ncbi:MAG: L-rhamnose-H+ transport protein [Verrucomicrobiota bacterium]
MNLIWCGFLNLRNKTGGDYFNRKLGVQASACPSAVASQDKLKLELQTQRVPLLANYLLCAVAGTLWYLQFFFYGMGTTKMGKYDFSSWTLHMASIIIFGTLLGLYLAEWKAASERTHWLMRLGLVVLISSTVIIGYGNYLAVAK